MIPSGPEQETPNEAAEERQSPNGREENCGSDQYADASCLIVLNHPFIEAHQGDENGEAVAETRLKVDGFLPAGECRLFFLPLVAIEAFEMLLILDGVEDAAAAKFLIQGLQGFFGEAAGDGEILQFVIAERGISVAEGAEVGGHGC